MKDSHYLHDTKRPDLTGEHRFGDLGQLLFAVLFTVIWITDTFFSRLTTFGGEYVQDWVQLAVGLILLGTSRFLPLSSLQTVSGGNYNSRTNLTSVIRWC